MKRFVGPVLLGICCLSGCSGGMPGGTRGGTPSVSLSATTLAFGHELVGTTSLAESITLKNTGTAPLSIVGLAATGDFTKTDTCGITLAAGAECTINVIFAPGSSGDLSGTLSVMDNAAGSPQVVALTGTGTVLGPRCSVKGQQCGAPQLPPCCSGLVCVPASVRAFCEP